MSEQPYPKQIDLSTFGPIPGIPSSYDNATREFFINFADQSGHRFSLEGSHGWGRPAGAHGEIYVREPGVLYIEYLSTIPNGIGIGTAVLAHVFRGAQELGMHQARGEIINSRVIPLLEKLCQQEIILATYYRIDDDTARHALIPTDEFVADASTLVSSEQAASYLQTNEKRSGRVNPMAGAIDCAIWF